MELAPIVLFVYNRPWHTKQTLEALMRNDYADQSTLFIYCDGAKENASEELLSRVKEVRTIIREKNWCKEVVIIEQKDNLGLADSIINGVTEIVNKYGKIIVLEDDIVTSVNFINYMNTALQRYENEFIVKQISAYAFDLECEKKNSAYFIPLTTTWGWATWKRVWVEINFNSQDYLELKSNNKLRKQFNLDDSYNYSSMLITQMESKRISSWGIRFWWNVFKNKGLVLHPDYSLVQNIGFDNSGVHCDDSDFGTTNNWNSNYIITNYPSKINIEQKKFKQLKLYLKSNLEKHKTKIDLKISFLIYLKKISEKLKSIFFSFN